ncbi:hypothetical protein D3C78_300060 [compost metagenome]
MAVGQAQELVGADRPGYAEERVEAANQRQVVTTTLDTVVEAQVGAGLRQARRVPVEEVLRAQGEFRVQRQAGGQLVARDEQFLGLGARNGQALSEVQARLAIAVAVGEGEDGFAPVLGMAAELGAEQGLLAEFHAAEDKGVEELGRRTIVVTVGVAADAPRIRAAIVELVGRRVEAADLVIGVVVPAVAADAKAHPLLVHHVQFGQQVDALRHRAAGGKVAVAVVVVEGVGQLGVGAFHPLGVVQLEGVVETHGPVLAARVELEGLHRSESQPSHDRGCQDPSAEVRVTDLIVVVHLTCSPSLLLHQTTWTRPRPAHAEVRCRMVTETERPSAELCCRAVRAPATWRPSASPRSCQTSSAICARPVAPGA